MRATTLVLLLLAPLVTVLAAPTAPAEEEGSCNPYPFERCGNEGEVRRFCYLEGRPRGVYESATDATAHRVTGEGVAPEGPLAADLLYVRATPTTRFVDDPWESDLPTGTLFRETNGAPGLQATRAQCGEFIWYNTCNYWMPRLFRAFEPDARIV